MQARIYNPSKSAMQAGRAGTGQWILEYEAQTPRSPDPLMGWTSSGDTLNQVRLHFESSEAAMEFARGKGLDYTVLPAHTREMQPRNYGDNFKMPPADDDTTR